MLVNVKVLVLLGVDVDIDNNQYTQLGAIQKQAKSKAVELIARQLDIMSMSNVSYPKASETIVTIRDK